MYYKWKVQGVVMETSTVCTNLTETSADLRGELSNKHRSRLHFGIAI